MFVLKALGMVAVCIAVIGLGEFWARRPEILVNYSNFGTVGFWHAWARVIQAMFSFGIVIIVSRLLA
jgi:hypothetical protein